MQSDRLSGNITVTAQGKGCQTVICQYTVFTYLCKRIMQLYVIDKDNYDWLDKKPCNFTTSYSQRWCTVQCSTLQSQCFQRYSLSKLLRFAEIKWLNRNKVILKKWVPSLPLNTYVQKCNSKSPAEYVCTINS